MGFIHYTILVKTGDKKFAGTDAKVVLVLHGDNNAKSKEIVLDNFFRNDFEAGMVDSVSRTSLWYSFIIHLSQNL